MPFEDPFERFAYVIDRAKSLPPLDEEYKIDTFLIKGCISQLWIFPQFKEGKCHYQADSDAAITKGTASLLCELYSDETPQAVIDLEPDFLAEVGSADEHYRIAVSYMQQEEYDRAIERLDQALRADPEMGEAYNTKAVILSNKGNYEEAYALLEKAEVQLPTHPGIRLNMAIVRYLQGRRHEAAVIYQQVIDTDDRYNGFLDFLLEEE